MLHAPPLCSGDQVALVCTGSVCDSKDEANSCRDYLKNYFNLNARFGQDLYLPLPAKVRAEILLSYLLDDNIKAIWSARGGEGTADILPYLAARSHEIRRATPKVLLGFSDFTALLVYFTQTFQWPVIHGLGARQLPQGSVDAESEAITKDWLLTKSAKIEFTLTPLNRAAFGCHQITAPVIGGNLSLIQLSLRDLWELRPQNKILLIEEVNEQPYQVARMLKHLQRTGFLDQVRAIIFAGCDFPGMDRSRASTMARKMRTMLLNFAGEVSVPVLFTEFIGHGVKNYPLPFGQNVNLHLDEGRVRLVCRADMV